MSTSTKKVINMKKILLVFLAAGLVAALAGCSDGTQQSGTNTSSSASNQAKAFSSSTKLNSLEDIESATIKDAEDTVSELTNQFEKLKDDVSTYETYTANPEKIESFYSDIVRSTEILCIKLRERSANYAELVLSSNANFDEKYDELEGIYDYIYEDASEIIYDDIYNGILDDMYDSFYNGVLNDGYNTAPYNEWSDMRSSEYNWWSDARSDVYEAWSDCRSEIYGLWSDLRSEVYGKDLDRAQKKLAKFEEKISKEQSKLS